MPVCALLMKVTQKKYLNKDGSVKCTMTAEVSGPILSMYKFNGKVIFLGGIAVTNL